MPGAWSRGILLLAAAMAGGCLVRRDPPPAPVLDAAGVERNLASFDQVWATVRDRHFDPTLGGIDWEAVRAELRPRVERARTADEARAVLSAMLERLNQSHFAVIPAEVYRDVSGGETPRDSAPDGSAGLDLRVLGSRATVVRVRAGGPADRAGVRPGWVLVRARGSDLAPLLDRVGSALADTPWRATALSMAAQHEVRGTSGERIEAVFEDGKGATRPLRLELAPEDGTPARLGWLPVQYLRFESRALDGGVGYIAFNVFLDPPSLTPAFEEAVRGFREAPGLVLDLRGNIGGIGTMAMGMGGWFVHETGRLLGTMRTRDTTLRFVLNPRAEGYAGPLAVLVDEVSVSTAEILAGGLQDLGRARVFGTRSAGAALPSAIERLPNGDGFQYAFADYVSAGGSALEGRGVIPDVEAALTRESLLAGRDPALEAALTWIRSRADR